MNRQEKRRVAPRSEMGLEVVTASQYALVQESGLVSSLVLRPIVGAGVDAGVPSRVTAVVGADVAARMSVRVSDGVRTLFGADSRSDTGGDSSSDSIPCARRT